MSRVDYYAIEEAIQTQLKAELDPENYTQIDIEREFPFSVEQSPWVGIFLERREATEDQPMASGTRTRLLVYFVIECGYGHLESQAEACKGRDELLGRVELALMADRTLGGAVAQSWLEGGELPSARLEGTGFFSMGEIQLVAETAAINS